MYLSTPLGKVIALDPVSGKQAWVRDVGVKRKRYFGDWVSRGVSYWHDPRAKKAAAVHAAHFLWRRRRTHGRARRDQREVVRGLRQGRRDRPRAALRNKQSYGDEYEQTSPPAVDRTISSSSAPPSPTTTPPSARLAKCAPSMRAPARCAGPGIRCRRIRPIRHTRRGAGGSASHGRRQHLVHHRGRPRRDLVFLPTSQPRGRLLRRHAARRQSLRQLRRRAARVDGKGGLALPDRASRSVGLRQCVAAGADRRCRDGRRAPCFRAPRPAQLFVLDRETGAPLFPVEERAVPTSDIPARSPSPTQPLSSLSTGFRTLTADDIWGATPEDLAECRARFAGAA